MTEEFDLSEKIEIAPDLEGHTLSVPVSVLLVGDVKDFIRRLKERFTTTKNNLWIEKEIKSEIDKLAGEKLK